MSSEKMRFELDLICLNDLKNVLNNIPRSSFTTAAFQLVGDPRKTTSTKCYADVLIHFLLLSFHFNRKSNVRRKIKCWTDWNLTPILLFRRQCIWVASLYALCFPHSDFVSIVYLSLIRSSPNAIQWAQFQFQLILSPHTLMCIQFQN